MPISIGGWKNYYTQKAAEWAKVSFWCSSSCSTPSHSSFTHSTPSYNDGQLFSFMPFHANPISTSAISVKSLSPGRLNFVPMKFSQLAIWPSSVLWMRLGQPTHTLCCLSYRGHYCSWGYEGAWRLSWERVLELERGNQCTRCCWGPHHATPSSWKLPYIFSFVL